MIYALSGGSCAVPDLTGVGAFKMLSVFAFSYSVLTVRSAALVSAALVSATAGVGTQYQFGAYTKLS